MRLNGAVRDALAAEAVTSITVAEVRTGSPPASANDAASGTLLATLTVSWGAGSAGSGQQAVSGTPSATAVASGEAGWVRFRNSGDTLRLDMTVGAEVTFADPDVVEGGTVTMTSGTVTVPAGS